jgi:hypothetical protein
LTVFHRPLVLVGALTAGDFLLWNWSLSANHDVLALIAGVTLLPLAAASLLLAALTALQLASRFSRHALIFEVLRRAVRPPRPHLRTVRRAAVPRPRRAAANLAASAAATTANGASARGPSAERRRKLAA